MNMRGDSPPTSGGAMPQSAFYSQAQEIGNRKDSSPVHPLCKIISQPSSSHMLTCTCSLRETLAETLPAS